VNAITAMSCLFSRKAASGISDLHIGYGTSVVASPSTSFTYQSISLSL
jgi:hypothetical protein